MRGATQHLYRTRFLGQRSSHLCLAAAGLGVVVGGSWARGRNRPDSDVDLGLYYDSSVFDWTAAVDLLRSHDDSGNPRGMAPPGAWGQWMQNDTGESAMLPGATRANTRDRCNRGKKVGGCVDRGSTSAGISESGGFCEARRDADRMRDRGRRLIEAGLSETAVGWALWAKWLGAVVASRAAGAGCAGGCGLRRLVQGAGGGTGLLRGAVPACGTPDRPWRGGMARR